jgi:hypothetical protein
MVRLTAVEGSARDFLDLAVATTRRGRARSRHVANTCPLEGFLDRLKDRAQKRVQ